MHNKFKIETKTSNPFLKIALLNANSNYFIDDNFLEIFYSLIDAQLHKKFNINEEIIVSQNDYYDFKVLKTNLFNLLTKYDIKSIHYEKFYTTLLDLGLDITKSEEIAIIKKDNKEEIIIEDYNSLDYKENKNIFTNNILNDNLRVFLLKQFLEKTNLPIFEKYIQQFETFHDSVQYNNDEIIKFIADSGVNINLLSKDGETVLMKVNKLNTLKILNKYNPDWFIKNNNQEEALNLFIQINDIEERKNIFDFSYQLISQTNPNVILKKQHTSLIELINNDKTKIEIVDFIKKQNLQNLDTIFDEHGNNLLMLSCMRGKVSKFDLFKSCDFSHFNNKNENIVKILLELNNIKTNDIKKVFSNIIENKDTIYSNLFTQIIENGFNDTKQSSIPYWLFSDSILSNKFFDILDLNKKEREQIFKLIQDKKNNWQISESHLFYDVYLSLLKKNKHIHYPNISNLLDNIFNNYEVTEKEFKFYSSFYYTKFEVFSTFVKATEKHDEFSEYRGYILEKFSQNFSKNVNSIFNSDIITDIKKSEYAEEFNKTISWLLENQVTSFIENIPRNILTNYFSKNKNLSEIITFFDLNNLIPQKHIKKSKKI